MEHDEEDDQPWPNLTMREKQQKARHWFGTRIILFLFGDRTQNMQISISGI